ncbi:MAG TPA: hypothetical protein VHZ97_24715 [Pseudonocardiaceae bacterium]|jgi:hypothetical protein|nr:hypothetical protein [Pseudonocardiaceae bacterium]
MSDGLTVAQRMRYLGKAMLRRPIRIVVVALVDAAGVVIDSTVLLNLLHLPVGTIIAGCGVNSWPASQWIYAEAARK